MSRLLLLVLAGAALFAGCGGGPTATDADPTVDGTSGRATEPRALEVGERAAIPFGDGGKLRLTLTRVVDPLPYEASDDGGDVPPIDGHRYVSVKLKVENKSEQEYIDDYDLYSGARLVASDSSVPAEVGTSASGCEEATALAAALAAGASVSACLVYMVPDHLEPARFVIAAADGELVRWKLRPSRTGASADGRTIVYALGDGGDGSAAARALADHIAAQRPDRLFYLGDVSRKGTRREFQEHYDAAYGQFADITDPVIGDNDYANRTRGYYPYWQQQRGWPRERATHRSYVDGASGWQIIAYSSEADPQSEADWVAQQLAKHRGTCRIALTHRGRHAVVAKGGRDSEDQEAIWTRLTGRTAINLVGHEHLYGRLAPISGVHVIVSGAGGGRELRSAGRQHHRVKAVKTSVSTATRLVLRRGLASFQQVDAQGASYDRGTIRCTPPR